MTDGTLLSVIIPVYNSAAYLPRCVDSILAAGIGGLEVLLIDDGSTDQSPEVCREYAAQHGCVRYYRQENAGPSAARNYGLELAAGRYIAFFDSDDWVLPTPFADAVSRLERCGADIWASDFHRVADNGAVLDRVYQIEESAEPLPGSYKTRFLSAPDCVWNVWRYIFRREYLDSASLRFIEGYSCGEDLEFIVRALMGTESIAFFHEPYYCYRVNYGDTLTRRYSAERVHQLMTMLLTARRGLDGSAEAQLLRQKLAREYILNLSLIYELPIAERRDIAYEYMYANSFTYDASGIYAVTAKVISILGIPITARILYMLKRIKRGLRRAKIKVFSRRKEKDEVAFSSYD